MNYRFVLSLLIAMFGITATAAEPPEALWQKAVGFASAAKEAKIVPGAVTMSTIVKKKDGTVESDSTLKFRTVDKGDELDMELVSAVENGKDITEEAKKQNEEDKKKAGANKEGKGEEGSASFSLGDHPFDPEAQKMVKAVFKSEVSLDGTPASLFTFVRKSADGKEVTRGRAWLETSTGMPLKVESSTDPLPDHVEKLVTRTTYVKTPEGLWIPSSSLITGEAGFLWMHFSTETRVSFLDHRISKAKV